MKSIIQTRLYNTRPYLFLPSKQCLSWIFHVNTDYLGCTSGKLLGSQPCSDTSCDLMISSMAQYHYVWKSPWAVTADLSYTEALNFKSSGLGTKHYSKIINPKLKIWTDDNKFSKLAKYLQYKICYLCTKGIYFSDTGMLCPCLKLFQITGQSFSLWVIIANDSAYQQYGGTSMIDENYNPPLPTGEGWKV